MTGFQEVAGCTSLSFLCNARSGMSTAEDLAAFSFPAQDIKDNMSGSEGGRDCLELVEA